MTDREGALSVLLAGIKVQSRTASTDKNGQLAYYRDSLSKNYDEAHEGFRGENDWWVAERDGEIIGVMRLMSEQDGMAGRYGREGILVVQELDGSRGAGTALLDEAKEEARRRGKRSILVLTVRNSEAHHKWYPSKGFEPFEDDGRSQMAPLLLRLDDGDHDEAKRAISR